MHRSPDENVLEDEHGRRLCVVNDTAVALWELCDGVTTIEEMVQAIRQVWRVDAATVTGDVSRALADLQKVGAIEGGATTWSVQM